MHVYTPSHSLAYLARVIYKARLIASHSGVHDDHIIDAEHVATNILSRYNKYKREV